MTLKGLWAVRMVVTHKVLVTLVLFGHRGHVVRFRKKCKASVKWSQTASWISFGKTNGELLPLKGYRRKWESGKGLKDAGDLLPAPKSWREISSFEKNNFLSCWNCLKHSGTAFSFKSGKPQPSMLAWEMLESKWVGAQDQVIKTSPSTIQIITLPS